MGVSVSLIVRLFNACAPCNFPCWKFCSMMKTFGTLENDKEILKSSTVGESASVVADRDIAAVLNQTLDVHS
jgi:hypothetical protein